MRKPLNKFMSLCHCLAKQLGYINWRISSTKSALYCTAAMHKSQATGRLGDNFFIWVYVYLYTYRVKWTGSTKVERSPQNCGSSVWNLVHFIEFEGCACIFGKFVGPWSTTSFNNAEVRTCHLQLMSKHSWRWYITHRTNICLYCLGPEVAWRRWSENWDQLFLCARLVKCYPNFSTGNGGKLIQFLSHCVLWQITEDEIQ